MIQTSGLTRLHFDQLKCSLIREGYGCQRVLNSEGWKGLGLSLQQSGLSSGDVFVPRFDLLWSAINDLHSLQSIGGGFYLRNQVARISDSVARCQGQQARLALLLLHLAYNFPFPQPWHPSCCSPVGIVETAWTQFVLASSRASSASSGVVSPATLTAPHPGRCHEI